MKTFILPCSKGLNKQKFKELLQILGMRCDLGLQTLSTQHKESTSQNWFCQHYYKYCYTWHEATQLLSPTYLAFKKITNISSSRVSMHKIWLVKNIYKLKIRLETGAHLSVCRWTWLLLSRPICQNNSHTSSHLFSGQTWIFVISFPKSPL